MNNQPKFKKGDRVRALAVLLLDNGMREYSPLSELEPYSPTPDMLAIPDDHVWPVTPDNEVVIVDELFEKQKESFIKAATSMTGSDTLTPEFKALGEFATKLDSVDQELEDAAIKSVGEIEDIVGSAIYNAFIEGATWKAEQSANDAIEFADWCEDNYWPTLQTGKWRAEFSSEDELLTTKQLYELWQQNKKK